MNTRFEYLYRDDANYKWFGSVLLSGTFSDADRSQIESKLDSGEMFVAEQIGLPSLRVQSQLEGVIPSIDDNGWHWLVAIIPTDDDGPTITSASELVQRFWRIKTWRPQMLG